MAELKKDDGFCINVYSPGNLIAKEITINGGVHLGNGTAPDAFSDEQIAQALTICVGKGKVIDAKWKWAGAYWFLRWSCNFPVDIQKFCDRIDGMKLDIPSEYSCGYESIRKFCKLLRYRICSSKASLPSSPPKANGWVINPPSNIRIA